MFRSRQFRLLFSYLSAVVFALALILGLWLVAPAFAQTVAKAAVVLDGQQLFQVSNSGEYSASERADSINSQLGNAVRSDLPIQVKIEQRNQLPTLLLNDRYLLTVTDRDTVLGSIPNEQASIWQERIQSALQQAHKERTTTYLQQTSLLAVVIVLVTAGLTWLLGAIKYRSFVAASQRLSPSAEASTDFEPLRALEFLLKLILALARIGLWMGAALYITNLFPFTRQWSYQFTNILVTSFTSPILTLSNNSYSVINLAILAALLRSLNYLCRNYYQSVSRSPFAYCWHQSWCDERDRNSCQVRSDLCWHTGTVASVGT